MGRRPDPPGLQRLKGFPGKRKAAVLAREAKAARVAKILGWNPLLPAPPTNPSEEPGGDE